MSIESVSAIQLSHPLSSPSPSVFSLSQNQGLFQWVSSSYHMARVLEFQLQHQSFKWIFRTDFLEDWPIWSVCSLKDSQVFSNTTVQKLVLSFIFNTHIHGLDAMILVFWMLSFKPTFALSSFTFTKRLFSSSSLSAKRLYNCSSYNYIIMYFYFPC